MERANQLIFKEKKRQNRVFLFGVIAVVLFSFVYLDVNILEIIVALPSFVQFIVSHFIPANFKNIATYAPLILETILFAVVGTYFSAFLAFFFGLLMSEQTNPILPLRMFVRICISLLRNIPVLVWASLLVYIFGIGNMVGLLALIFATIGFLSRSYADSIDEIGSTKLEALKSSGASFMQVLVHGLLPEFIPSWINWTLFSFEINIRASAILGMVGAGGIGIMIQTNIRLFKYHEAFSLIIVLVVMVLLTEFVVSQIRKKVS
ncbi:phosphonate transport system permease protein [Pilibacter termitis]|uniref:Phosphonate transport system permease protein n=1 Tax=Pilibacter termitis TaxID=263852 RepID=A0A1T4KDL8_9ENTE|nr:phosphonate ABC transporter, permease protein PhnE [Pilibacter termitis]SJZ40524.1 phosphonate transport system permease protein [Pilibacter termitis]